MPQLVSQLRKGSVPSASQEVVICRAADLHYFTSDPDPAFHFDADLDSSFHFNADLDPDRDLVPHPSDPQLHGNTYRSEQLGLPCLQRIKAGFAKISPTAQ